MNRFLIVKYLDSSITNASLHTIFSKYGTILSCKVAEENGKSKGFRFVQFDSEDSALSAIAALHQSFLEGKQLYVSKFIKKEEFSEYGNISTVVVMKDSAGVSKGFGFVEFNSHEDAKKAMEALNPVAHEINRALLLTEVLQKLSSMQRLVVSTGGGAVIRPINWRHMQKGFSVWLDVPVEALARRITSVRTESRPLVHNESGDAYAKPRNSSQEF
ncbi:hypothetical protein POM88_006567 [Heracleum sosnowskyi]|uniref:RRM domain-containing protein n=1 Tax=Heracleum sosnowskyi TaxID=360622 RepID=A0AAD8J4H9_9APIA|nr:hypothetical protein POM88_006567 [Heracleum sosnowskyi]